MWAVARDSSLLHGDLEIVKLLFYEYLSALFYKYMFQIIAKYIHEIILKLKL